MSENKASPVYHLLLLLVLLALARQYTRAGKAIPRAPPQSGSLAQCGLGQVHSDVSKCPPCNCTTTEKLWINAKCQSQNLTDVPQNLSLNTWSISLLGNRVDHVNFTGLLRYSNLTTFILNLQANLKNVSNMTSATRLPSVLYLDLGHNQISSVDDNSFVGFASLRNLSLRHNYVKVITNVTFSGLFGLQSLNLSANRLTFIDFGAFDDLKELKTLDLTGNEDFAYSSRHYHPRLFENLPVLKNVFLQGNDKSSEVYPSEALGAIKNLAWLKVDGVHGSDPLGPQLKNLIHFKRLEIGTHAMPQHFCRVKNITASYFVNVPHLESISFQYCRQLRGIHEDAYKPIPNLRFMSITTAAGYQLMDAFMDLKGLQNSSLKSLTINGATQHDSSPCMTLTAEYAKYLQNIQLTRLDLSSNRLGLLRNDFNDKLPVSLRVLILRDNSFPLQGWLVDRILNLVNLEYLDISGQTTDIFYRATDYLHRANKEETPVCKSDSENFENEKLQNYGDREDFQKQEFFPMKYESEAVLISATENHWSLTRESTKLADARKETANEENLEDNHIVRLPPKLEVIIGNTYANFGYGILVNRLIPDNILTEIDLSNSFMGQWGTGKLPPNVTKADLSYNYCSDIHPGFFSKNSPLVHLNIRNNVLGSKFADDVHGDIFSQLNHLLYLDISTNIIYHLNPLFFKGLNKLQYLDLSQNKLQSLNTSFAQCKDLHLINASMNSLAWISRQVRRDLDHLAQHHSVVLDVTLNPLPCSCTGIEVMEWLANTNVTIQSADFLKCRYDDSTIADVGSLQERVIMLKRMCFSFADLFAFCVSIVVGFGIFLCLSLAYRYRWWLLYVLYWKLLGYEPSSDSTTGSHSRYDALVVHTDAAYEFVLGEMRRQLIQQRGHKLCIPNIDFLPGTVRVTNTLAAVRESRVTLVVVTSDFAEDSRASYALKMAYMDESHSGRDNAIFLVILREVAADGVGGTDAGANGLLDDELERRRLIGDGMAMPPDLLPVIQRDDFIEFPAEGQPGVAAEVIQAAWDRISARIGHAHQRDNI